MFFGVETPTKQLLHSHGHGPTPSRLDDAVDVEVKGLQLREDLQEVDDEVLHQHGNRVLRGCLILSSCSSASWNCAWIFEHAGVFLVARGEGS